MSDSTTTDDPCNCCQSAAPPAPTIENRPGLPELSYRGGTYATIFRRMIANLPTQSIPDSGQTPAPTPLGALTTRAQDDFSIALLDAGSVVADILRFYLERIANEGFLRTATERRSVLELARAIGYELRPGVAASVPLALTIEDAAGSPGVAVIPRGLKVQSVPGPGQKPQTFEAAATVNARADWNALRPRMARPQELVIWQGPNDADPGLYMLGLSTRFAAGESVQTINKADYNKVFLLAPVLSVNAKGTLDPADTDAPPSVRVVRIHQVAFAGTAVNLKLGDLLLLVGANAGTDPSQPAVKSLALKVHRVEVDTTLKQTRVDLAPEATRPSFSQAISVPAIVFIEPFFFGAGAIFSQVISQTWRESDLNVFLSIQQWDPLRLVAHVNQPAPFVPAPVGTTGIVQGFYAFRARLGIFGNNAPQWYSLPDPAASKTRGGVLANPIDPYPNNWDDPAGDKTFHGWPVWKDPQTNAIFTDATLHLEREVPGLIDGGWCVLEKPSASPYTAYLIQGVNTSSLSAFALTGRSTALTLETDNGATLADEERSDEYLVRTTTAHVMSELLSLADLPIDDPITKGTKQLTLDRMILGLQVGQTVLLSGTLDDLSGVEGDEAVVLADILHSGGFTTLVFRDGLKFDYTRGTVTINANVAPATHGEAVAEVVGSGDASRANLQFKIKRPPLTYVSAQTPSGTQSTLSVRVDGVLWQEVPRFVGLDARTNAYIVRRDDDGTTRVIFGDGITGARPSTGVENITAAYRTGIGLEGMVAAGTLTVLQSRPLGLRSVTNPLPASGAADPEQLERARTNAPLTVLTLDRIVSLQDYEDFARAFAGIGKAQAIAYHRGAEPLVHITIAAEAGDALADPNNAAAAPPTHIVDPTSPLQANLVAAIAASSDPIQQFDVGSYQPLFFNIKARVLADPTRIASDVRASAADALRAAFAFELRGFGQPVTEAEVVTVIQGTPGVIATVVDQLLLLNQPPLGPNVPDSLPSSPARFSLAQDRVIPGHLLLINPVGITIEELTP